MDWSKAKTILIAALLITNVILGSFYFNEKNSAKKAEEKAAENAVAFAEGKGVSFETPLPESEEKLPVVFVRFQSSAQPQVQQYRGLSVEAPTLSDTEVIPEKEGDNSGKLIPVSEAILRFIDSFENGVPEKMTVTGMELVYIVYGSADLGAALEDTAVPAWKFITSSGNYYVEAFAQ